MYPGIWQILLIILVIVLLFGRGKIPDLMGDLAKGIKSFKKGISEDDDEAKTVKGVDHEAAETGDSSKSPAAGKTETS